MKENTSKLVKIALFSVLAAGLTYLKFSLPLIPQWLEINFSDLPALMAGFGLGPIAGGVVILIKCLLKLMLQGTSTAFIGDLADLLMGLAFVLPAAIIYKYKRNFKGAALGLAASILTFTLVGCALNYYVLMPLYIRLYFGSAEQAYAVAAKVNKNITNISTYVMYAVIPFNIIKGTMVSALSLLVYKRLSRLINALIK